MKYNKERGVYKFQYQARQYYRLGQGILDARQRLARELKVEPKSIEILDNGDKT